MSAARLTRRWPSNSRALLVVVLAAVGCLMIATSEAGATSSGTSTASPLLRAPLESSLTTTDGAWANVAMGDLGQLTNTFWQLFFLPTGHVRWSLVTPPGFADNGGLVTAQDGSHFVVGFETSQLIHFSPMASTANGGTHWTPGILDSELATVPDALAGTASGRIVALTGEPANSIVSNDGDLSSWHPLVGKVTLATSVPGRRCGLLGLTAVAFSPSSQLLVGATCSRPGTVGIFENSGGNWHLVGPPPAATGPATMSVLRLRAWDGGVSALIASHLANKTELLGTRLAGEANWSTPVPLALAAGGRLVSSGVSAEGELGVLVSTDGRLVAEVLTVGARSWTELPHPPARTAVIAFDPGGAIDAFAVLHSQLTIYRLSAGSSSWQRVQTMQVPIQYGSSS